MSQDLFLCSFAGRLYCWTKDGRVAGAMLMQSITENDTQTARFKQGENSRDLGCI
jgi:hypothetical protein